MTRRTSWRLQGVLIILCSAAFACFSFVSGTTPGLIGAGMATMLVILCTLGLIKDWRDGEKFW